MPEDAESAGRERAHWKYIRESFAIPQVSNPLTHWSAGHTFDMEVIERGFVADVQSALAHDFHGRNKGRFLLNEQLPACAENPGGIASVKHETEYLLQEFLAQL